MPAQFFIHPLKSPPRSRFFLKTAAAAFENWLQYSPGSCKIRLKTSAVFFQKLGMLNFHGSLGQHAFKLRLYAQGGSGVVPRKGRNNTMTVSVCVGSSCHMKGSYQVVKIFGELIKENDLESVVTLKASFCMGRCLNGISVLADDRPIQNVGFANAQQIFMTKFIRRLSGKSRRWKTLSPTGMICARNTAF